MRQYIRNLINLLVITSLLISYKSVSASPQLINKHIENNAATLPLFQLPYGYDADNPNQYEPVFWSGGPHEYGNLKTQDLFSNQYGSGLDFSAGPNYKFDWCNKDCSFIVRSMAEGEVIFVGEGSFGKQVAVKNQVGGTVIIYGHLYDFFPSIQEGYQVQPGSAIGHAGHTRATGVSDFPVHLHIELRDGADTCTSYCVAPDGLGGNPLSWNGVRIGDFTIFDYRESSDTSAKSYNYDGVAVNTSSQKVRGFDKFKFPDVDFFNNPPLATVTQTIYTSLPYSFKCEPSNTTDCENNNNFSRYLDVVFAGHGRFGGGGSLSPKTAPSSDDAAFGSDLSLPDGSIVSPNQSLTKTWRLQNSGFTTWGSGYQLVFLRGDRMGAPAFINVPSTAPGQNVDLSVTITAPSTPGIYKGYWRLRNPQGTYFGPEIWVSLEVATQGSHITVFSADPPSPSDTTSVRIRARVENFSNFRALRMKVDNQVICEETTLEATCSWNTAGYAAGSHNIMVEVADQTDTSWSRSEKRSMVYTLTGTGASSNHIPNRPSLVANPVYDWYVYYSGNTAQLCAQPNGDPDGDAITGYYFEVTGAESWNSGWVGSSCVTTGGLGPHTYAFRAKVRDSRGGESDWSDSWHFTLVNPTLSITQLDFQPLDSNSEQVRVRACTAGQGGIGITMKVMVNEANDGSGNGKWNTIYELGVPCFNDTDAPTWHTLKYSDGTHRVRVEAHGLNTGWDGAAVLERTYTIPHRRPSGSDLYAPVPESRDSNEAVYLNNQTITFKWENVLRNNNYTLYVSTTTNPQTDPNPVLNQTVGTNVTEYTAPFNQEYPILYWQVLSNGDAGTSSSNIQKFGIDRTSPSCTVQALEPTVFDNAFKVTWQGTDDVAGVASYDIQYLDSNRSEWVDWQTEQPITKTFDLFNGQPGHTYSFRCRSIDAAGNQGTYPSTPNTTTKIDPTSRPQEPWWNTGYGVKRNLIILNNDTDWMPPHFPVRVHFDGTTTPTAAEIYNASISATKGNDIRLVYQNQTELNRVVQRFSNSQIDIWIPLQAGLGSGVSDSANYQIYYGNANAGAPPANVGAVFMPEADTNTIGLWHFQEGSGTLVSDSSGNAKNGSFSNGSWNDGFLGWTGAFNGTNSAVTIPHSSVFNVPAITVEAWINLTTYNNKPYPIVMKRLINTPGGFEFHVTNDRELRWITENGWMNSSYGLTLNQWYHVAVTSNGVNQLCIYVNGINVKCQPGGAMAFNNAAVTIGFIHNGDGDFSFAGYIQHVRISNIARTDFPYARINTQPSVSVGIQQTPTVEGEADLVVISLNTYPNSEGGVLVETVVKNQGTVSTTNGFYTDLYINHLPSGAGDYTGSLQFWVNDPIPAGGTTTLTTIISDLSQLDPLSTALAPGEEKISTLYVQTDSTGSLTEADKANNIYPSAIVNLQIPIVADDYDSFEDETIFNLSGDSSHNNWIGTSPKVMSGWVFKDVSIPKGATILSAKLYLRGYGMDGIATARLYGFAEDDAQPFTINGANKPSLRPLTNSFVDWSNTWPFAWTVFESPDVSGIIQELVNRPGWTTSNNLGIRASNPSGVGTNWAVVDYADGEGHSVTLEVSYLDPSIESSAQICIAENDIYEQDNTYQSAQEIDRQQVHNFNKPNDEDWVKLFAKQGQTHKIQTSNLGPNSDTYLYLYGPDGTTLLASNDDYGESLASQIEWTAPSDGTYYIQVKQWNPSLGGCGMGYNIGTGGVQTAIYLPLVIR